MAHYAFLDNNNVVTEVITGIDETELIEGLTPEVWYGNFRGQKCIRTSYNGNIRGMFAGIGFIYDEDNDIFIPVEPDITDFQASWMGIYSHNGPSLMVDAAPRSANRWVSIVLNQAFPDVFMRWGYRKPHNPQTFEKAKDKFNSLLTIVRNPLDSLASSIVFYDLKTNENIVKQIDQLIETFNQIKNNRNSIDILTFEEVTDNMTDVVEHVGLKLNKTPVNVDVQALKSSLETEFAEGNRGYVVPNNNTLKLEEAKSTLLDSIFTSKLQEVNDLYNALLGYAWKP